VKIRLAEDFCIKFLIDISDGYYEINLHHISINQAIIIPFLRYECVSFFLGK
jgi:hypothetical protein